jgi:hypothetical protein
MIYKIFHQLTAVNKCINPVIRILYYDEKDDDTNANRIG